MPTKSTILGDNPTPNVNHSPPTNTNEPVSILPHAIVTTLDNISNVHDEANNMDPPTEPNQLPSNKTAPSTTIVTQTQTSECVDDSKIISNTNNSTLNSTNDDFMKVFHKESAFTVLSKYCLPVSQTPLDDKYVCKFPNRYCVMKRCKIFEGIGGTNVPELSETAFQPNPKHAGTLTYSIVDVRIMKCCQPTCTNGLDGSPKLFHYSCFIHSFCIPDNRTMDIVELLSEDDKVLKFLDIKEPLLTKVINAFKKGAQIVFPCCGKRCSKIVIGSRKETKKISMLPAITSTSIESKVTPPNWDKDGSHKCKSSIDVLIHWLTTEENATKYFGGLDKDGKTSSDRKESYHNGISDIIKKENGKTIYLFVIFIFIYLQSLIRSI
jgi:hypothetical protein